jgi:hypothetical protein
MFAWLHRRPTPASKEKLRIVDALVDYPPYTPPIWHSDAQSMKDAGEAYESYFLDNRKGRVEALGSFLAKFDVALSLEDAGVKAVSAWCPTYADLLVDGLQHQESEDLWRAYNWFQAPWTGPLIGLNPIFDLGVFFGERLLYRNRRLNWRPLINPEPGRGASHPIFGQRRGRPFDPIKWAYTECKNFHSARIAKESPDPALLFRVIEAQAAE